ncbi:hypothetical protein FHS18_005521 [Paenibacillus phyllosphaerae]|uniref:Uncharacterized protein n=1 Tax=Paenibacillus phyllosphaerae TaxID=274593 RepID=A0A7W5B3C5_9BACL|nr:hypothetical protein [Paenibacillus phyllosphaerae]MBB3113409.1 hypothetical protein [Paenibacillus phyllosphaerae]
MNEVWDGFGQRMRKLNPLFSLGRGMEIGSLAPYAQGILLRVILELFYRELNDREDRSRRDIEQIVADTVQEMGLTANEHELHRIAAGLIHQGAEQLNKPFESLVYNEQTREWESSEFRYVTMDELFSDLPRGLLIYKLTEEAQEIIFVSREISEEFSISIEQLYSLQLIKNGNFKKAASSLDLLLARVRRLILDEQLFQRQVANDPKVLVLTENKQREDNQAAINQQFETEKKEFRNILALIDRLQQHQDRLEGMNDLLLLRQKVEVSRQQHDRFARLVVQSIATEIRLKSENPALFWERGALSFSEHVFEEWIAHRGIHKEETLEALLAPLFSPHNEFILPLDWLWGEQEISLDDAMDEEDLEDIDSEQDDRLKKRVIDWDAVATAWAPVIDELLQVGECSISALKEEDADVQNRWLADPAAREMWMLFTRKPLVIEALNPGTMPNDERLKLLHHLIRMDHRFKALEGKTMASVYDREAQPIDWNGMRITPLKLVLKERDSHGL